MVRPGVTLDEMHQRSVEILTEGMVRLGLLKGEPGKLIEEEAYKKFYMHRLGHYLGLDVHDAGAYHLDGKPRPVEPGMVMTVEPGLYVAEDAEDIPDQLPRHRHPHRGRRARHRRRPPRPHRQGAEAGRRDRVADGEVRRQQEEAEARP